MGAKIPFKKRWKRVGGECWFIGEGSRWFRCKIVARVNAKGEPVTHSPCTLILAPVKEMDSKHQVAWPYGKELPIRFWAGSQQALRVRDPDEKPPL